MFIYQQKPIPKRGEKIMQKLNVQTSRSDIYENSPDFLSQLKEHIKLETLIPSGFKKAYYKNTGRPRGNSLESFLWYFILRNLIGITEDVSFLFVLKYSPAFFEFCGFVKVPPPSDITTFRERFGGCIELMFHNMVDITEPICKEIDEKKSGYMIYDTSGVEANVKENNPKFMNSKLETAKKIAKNNPEYNPYKGVYNLLPDTAQANVNVKQQYINGHFCYAHKFGIITNGLGIVRHLAFFDERFKDKHPEIVSQKTDNPDLDKEISDSASLKPVLSDFFDIHPHFKGNYHTFHGDAGFDSYDIYPMLRYDFNFARMCIPMNNRNSDAAHNDFDENGTPLCPIDKTPFVYDSICRGQNRSERFKYICPKSVKIKGRPNPVCTCDNPCTQNSYKCSYVYPHKNLRLYPGIPRGTEHWDNLYRHRVLVERTINIIKEDFGAGRHKSFSSFSAKSELFLAGITQLICVFLAYYINNSELFKSARKLIRVA
jgi:hypothetical protein